MLGCREGLVVSTRGRSEMVAGRRHGNTSQEAENTYRVGQSHGGIRTSSPFSTRARSLDTRSDGTLPIDLILVRSNDTHSPTFPTSFTK